VSRRYGAGLVIAFLLLSCLWLAAALAATPGADAPTVTLSAPAAAEPGAKVSVRGRVAELEGRGSVRAQLLDDGSWRTLARRSTGAGRFQLSVRLPAAGTAASLRAVVVVGGRTVARSATDRVRLQRAPDVPTPPVPASSGAAASAAPPAVVPEPVVVPPDSVYWGAWIDPGTPEQPAPINPTAISNFEAIAGKAPSILESYSAWKVCSGETCSSEYQFPQQQLEAIRARGAIPLFSWAGESSSGEVSQPKFELADVAKGDYDPYIVKWATAARDWGHPFFLRFDWEMNGNWFPWGQGVNNNQPGDYVAAWRHVHQIFTQVGATNATWVWCPFAGPRPLSGFYPGDEYVDWTCLDGYNNTMTTAWRPFKQIFSPGYKEITETIAPTKPMLIAEFASSEQGAPAGTSKAQWITQAFEALPTEFPRVRGVLWFNYDEAGKGWPLTTAPATEAAFRAGIADPRYLTNVFGSLAGPIPVP
jgi:hypothetical protein